MTKVPPPVPPSITVTFWGICIFLRKHKQGIQLPIYGRRMVMLNAGPSGCAEVQKVLENKAHGPVETIDPHQAQLHIRNEDLLQIGDLPVKSLAGPNKWAMFHLDGVRLTIPNSIGEEFDSTGTRCLQSLPGLVPNLGAMSPAAVVGEPSVVSAFFDFKSGTLSSVQYVKKGKKDGPAVTVHETRTEGDPEIHVTPFGTCATTVIRIRPGASVAVTNEPDYDNKYADAPDDFMLNYLLAASYPANPQHASPTCQVTHKQPDHGGHPVFATPACSNTGWP
ncbi:MAG TPA: hypothetical protein VMU84_15495 [Thermoanaerobaculia bacterium]|nr:hypothetical protein [Thermoanaerobaculia bacterium]